MNNSDEMSKLLIMTEKIQRFYKGWNLEFTRSMNAIHKQLRKYLSSVISIKQQLKDFFPADIFSEAYELITSIWENTTYKIIMYQETSVVHLIKRIYEYNPNTTNSKIEAIFEFE